MYILIQNAMKIGEKQRTMLAQTQYSVLSASLCSVCVCDVRLPNFALVILPQINNGRHKIFVQNKIFSWPTDPTFWAVCNQNQTIIFSPPNVIIVIT